jgi:hypothetical protein
VAQAEDVIELARILQAEPNTGQRWNNLKLITLVDRAQKMLMRTLRWPEARYVFQTNLAQEYQIPEMIRVLRVYIAGQIIEQTSIPTLQGQQTGVNDQSGTGGGPGGFVGTGVAPVLAGGQFGPAWVGQGTAVYPVSTAGSYTSPASPWFIGRRPAYYMRSGNIGFVPGPLGSSTCVIDCIAQPPTLQNLQDALMVPDIAVDCLAWKLCEFMSYADDEQGQDVQNSRDYALKGYRDALAELRMWRRTYDGVTSTGPNVFALRTFYRGIGQNRNYSNSGTNDC